MNIVYEQLISGAISSKEYDEIGELFLQLSPQSEKPMHEGLCNFARAHIMLVARREGGIVGMASLIRILKMSGPVGWVDYVVVHNSCRGMGIGEGLMREILRRAASLGIERLELTTRPSREAANRLYARLGFKKKETNFLRLELKP